MSDIRTKPDYKNTNENTDEKEPVTSYESIPITNHRDLSGSSCNPWRGLIVLAAAGVVICFTVFIIQNLIQQPDSSSNSTYANQSQYENSSIPSMPGFMTQLLSSMATTDSENSTVPSFGR